MDQWTASNSRSNRSVALPGFSFEDAKNAYRSKTSWEIVRALAVFRLCSYDFLVNKNREVSKDFTRKSLRNDHRWLLNGL